MTNLIIKGNAYRLIDNKSFEIPLPLKYTLLKEDTEIAEYEISADESVSFHILTKYKENMITPINRPMTISDIYYFFSSRVFQDKTPFTASELSLLGLDKYNVYNIVRKTRGITPYDTYWIKFKDDDTADYDTARKEWDDIMSKTAEAPVTVSEPVPVSVTENSAVSDIADISEILNQHKVNVDEKAAELASENITPAEEPFSNTTMSEDEIEKLLIQSGLAEAPAEQPAPAETSSSSGGNMSPEDIAKLFAAAENTPSEEPAPVETSSSSGGNMSPEDIAKLFAAAENTPSEEPAVNDEVKAEAARMGREDIEKMLSEVGEPIPDTVDNIETADSVADEIPQPDDIMSSEDIEKMLNDNVTAVIEPTDINSKPSDNSGKLSPDEIEALLGDMKKDAQT